MTTIPALLAAVAVLAAVPALAETGGPVPGVQVPVVGVRYGNELDLTITAKSGAAAKRHNVIRREVVASSGDSYETRYQGSSTMPSGAEVPISGTMTYRLFFLTDATSVAQPNPDKPPSRARRLIDCPADALDGFYPRGAAQHVSVSCTLTQWVNGAQSGSAQSGSAQSGSAQSGSAQSGSAQSGDGGQPKSVPVTVEFSDLGPGRDTTKAGTFDIRKIAVQFVIEGLSNVTVNDFAPALGISVVQDLRESTPGYDLVTHSEVTDFAPAP